MNTPQQHHPRRPRALFAALLILHAAFHISIAANAGNTPPALPPLFDTSQAMPAPLPDKAARIEQLEKFFRPPITDIAALSPDGRYLAYSSRQDDKLFVFVAEAGTPGKILTKRVALTDADAGNSYMAGLSDSTARSQIHWMAWFPQNRLALEINRCIAQYDAKRGFQEYTGAIVAMNADGSHAALLATPVDMLLGVYSPTNLYIKKHPPSASSLVISPQSGFVGSEGNVSKNGTSSPNYWPRSDIQLWSGMENDWVDDSPLVEDSKILRQRKTQNILKIYENAKPINPSHLINAYYERPRTFQVLGFCPDDPQSILLRTGSTLCGIYKLNVFSGKLHESSETGLPPSALFFDRQGRPALWAIIDMLGVRHGYLYNTDKGWRNLDTMISPNATPSVKSFSMPETKTGKRAIPIGFDTDPNILYYTSNIGRATYGIYALNLITGRPTGLAVEDNTRDLANPGAVNFVSNSILVYDRQTQKLVGIRIENDRQTVWLDSERQAEQRTINHALPARDAKILDWSTDGARYLVQVSGAYEPGAFYLYERPANKLVQFARSMPWIEPAMLGEQSEFGFTNAAGNQVTGVLTMPAQPRAKTIPVIVTCVRIPSERRRAFRAEIFALALMGYAVVEIDAEQFNGSLYVLSREIFLALDNLARQQTALNFKQVFLFGESYAGTTALELLRANPDRFRGAIAINPVVSDRLYRTLALGETLVPKNTKTVSHVKTASKTKAAPKSETAPQLIGKPIYILAARNDRYSLAARDVYESVRKRGVDCAFDALPRAYAKGDSQTKATVYNRIGNFIYGVITNAQVILGPMRVIEDPKPSEKTPKPEKSQ